MSTDVPENEPEPASLPNGWVKLFSPRGPQVTLPVPCESAVAALAWVNSALDVGWLMSAPGLEQGENKDEIGWVVKTFVGESGTPAIDLYPANEAMHFSILRVYLNKPEDEAAFEYASKLKLDQLPEYVGTGKLERGKSPQTDKLIFKVSKPFGMVWKDNPRYNPDETDATKKKPKRVFVRWVDQKPQETEQHEKEQHAPPAESPDAKVVAEWSKFIDSDPSVEKVNVHLPHIKEIAHAPTRKAVWSLVNSRLEKAGYTFDITEKQFVEVPF